VEAIRSPIFRGLMRAPACIGFNAPDAYELLHLSEQPTPAAASFTEYMM